MIDDIVLELTENSPENISEISELKSLLQAIGEESAKLRLAITKERWLAVGAHLLAFVRRMANGERLPTIEAELFAEIHPDMILLSRRILYGNHPHWREDETEVFLLAVHFEAIRAMYVDGT